MLGKIEEKICSIIDDCNNIDRDQKKNLETLVAEMNAIGMVGTKKTQSLARYDMNEDVLGILNEGNKDKLTITPKKRKRAPARVKDDEDEESNGNDDDSESSAPSAVEIDATDTSASDSSTESDETDE